MTVTLQYIAGILDGEGSFSITGGSHKRQPNLAISMAKTSETEALLRDIQAFFGCGYIRVKPKKYWAKYRLNAQDQICWSVQGRHEALKVGKLVLPYLRVKARQCKVLVEHCQRLVST